MEMNDNLKSPQTQDEPKPEYRSEEYVVCPVCGHVSRKPAAICPYCSNYLFADSGDNNN